MLPCLSPCLRIAVVASNLPRRCGIATFSADLMAAVKSADPSVSMLVAAIDEPNGARFYGDEVRWRIRQGDARSYRAAAEAINASEVDIVIVQHEFGLYGIWVDGVYEDHLRVFLDALRKPVVTTLHTLPVRPSPAVRDAVRSMARLSDEMVVMAQTAQNLLGTAYGITEAVTVIPHGMPATQPFGGLAIKDKLSLLGRTLITTFGLVDPRKGLEYMIEAMPAILARHPDALYLIAGQTHPDVARQVGEQYRDLLISTVGRLGLQGQVSFRNEFMPQRDIIELLVATDVYVTPYLDPEQITSGTLAYALGAGKAIVSTAYLHALEALAEDRGVIVGFRDSRQLAEAVNSILDDPDRKRSMGRNAYAYAKDMAWPKAGERWLKMMSDVLPRSVAAPLLVGGHRLVRN